MSEAPPIIYCFDSSAFIDAWRRFYSPELSFCRPLWERIEALMKSGRLIIHEEVITELKDKDDDVYKFVKKYPDIIRPTNDGQMNFVVDIFTNHSGIIDKKRTQKNHADAWVIALAKETGTTVVTFEGPGEEFGIPKVSEAYKVPCLLFRDFLKKEAL